MNRTIFIFIISFFSFNLYSQNDSFLSNRKKDFLEIMTSHFENIVSNYYAIEPENSHEAIKRFVSDSSKLNQGFDDLKKLANTETYELLKSSKIELKNYIWISEKQKQQKSKHLSYSELPPQTKEALNDNTKEYLKNLEAKNSELTINYYGEYGNSISVNSNSDIADLITTFKELRGNSDSGLIATALVNLTNEDYKNKATKTFIAFELFYACLNSHLDNE